MSKQYLEPERPVSAPRRAFAIAALLLLAAGPAQAEEVYSEDQGVWPTTEWCGKTGAANESLVFVSGAHEPDQKINWLKVNERSKSSIALSAEQRGEIGMGFLILCGARAETALLATDRFLYQYDFQAGTAIKLDIAEELVGLDYIMVSQDDRAMPVLLLCCAAATGPTATPTGTTQPAPDNLRIGVLADFGGLFPLAVTDLAETEQVIYATDPVNHIVVSLGALVQGADLSAHIADNTLLATEEVLKARTRRALEGAMTVDTVSVSVQSSAAHRILTWATGSALEGEHPLATAACLTSIEARQLGSTTCAKPVVLPFTGRDTRLLLQTRAGTSLIAHKTDAGYACVGVVRQVTLECFFTVPDGLIDEAAIGAWLEGVSLSLSPSDSWAVVLASDDYEGGDLGVRGRLTVFSVP